MNLNDIAANFKDLPQVDRDSYEWDRVEDMLAALFSDVVRPRSEQFLPDLLDPERVAVHVVVASGYGGMHILAIDEKPLAVFVKGFGSREDSQTPYTLDVEAYAQVATEMVVAETKKRLANVTAAGDTAVRKLDSSYLYFLGSQGTMFAIKAPNEVYQYAKVIEAHRGFYVDSTGVAHEVENIGEFSGEKEVSVSLVGGQQVLVEASQLMFELVPGKGNVEDAMTYYAADPHWLVESAMKHVLMVSILMQQPYRWSTKLVLIQFDTEAEFDRFSATYPVGKKDEHLQRGVFSFDKLGFFGKELCRD